MKVVDIVEKGLLKVEAIGVEGQRNSIDVLSQNAEVREMDEMRSCVVNKGRGEATVQEERSHL